MKREDREARYYDLKDEVKRLLRHTYQIGSEIGLSDEEISNDIQTEILCDVQYLPKKLRGER